MMPVLASTLRMTWSSVSAIYRFPALSRVTDLGFDRFAPTARPPSPQGAVKQEFALIPLYLVVLTPTLVLLPATVVMMPVSASTRRIKLFGVLESPSAT